MKFTGFERGMGIGGWLTNYKRFHVLPQEKRLVLTVGDFEHFKSYITEADVAYIASLGMDHIRLGFDQLVVEEAPGRYRENIFCLIDHFIDWCRKYHLHVVLNLHKAIGNYCDIDEDIQLLDSKELQARFLDLWLTFEKRYAAYPEVAFELLNEVKDVDPTVWNDLAEKALKAIRALNPARKVIIGSTAWNSFDTVNDLRIHDDKNVIYTFHMYAPHIFTHQRGVLSGGNLYYNRNMEYPGDIEKYKDTMRVIENNSNAYKKYGEMGYEYICDSLAPVLSFKKKHPDRLLWLGEFGTIRHINIKYRENYMRDVIRFCLNNDIPYCVWNYLSTPNDGNRFSLVDDDTRKILSKEMARIIRGDL